MNKDIITVYSRHQLDESLSARLGMKVKATDEQWQQVSDSVHDDGVWQYMDNVILDAESQLIEQLIEGLE